MDCKKEKATSRVSVYLARIPDAADALDGYITRMDATRAERATLSKKNSSRYRAELISGLLIQYAVVAYKWQDEFCILTMDRLLAGLPENPIDLSYRIGPNGKPDFEDGKLHFSLSHSGDYVLVAISDKVVGADLQLHRDADGGERDMRTAERFFHEKEKLMLRDYPEMFYTLWTRKEAYAKLGGEGVVHFLGEDFTNPETSILPQVNMSEREFVCPVTNKKYSICICG